MTTEQRHETAQLTPGTILKTAREQRGMSQQDVAHRLNLRIALIRDIEEDRFDQKTASTFTRGYLKTYARFVGTDEQAVLAAYDRLGLKDQQYSEMYSFSGRTQREASEHRVRFISWVLFIGLAGLGGTWWWLQPAEEPVPTAINEAGQLVVKATDAVLAAKPSAAQATTANPVATTSAAPVTATSSAEDTAETSTDLPVAADNEGQEPTVLSNAAAEEKNQEQTKVIPSSAAVASTEATQPEATDSKVDASIALQLQFKASCWLRVADASGKSLFEGTKNAGDKVNVSGKEPFSLTIGAPRSVSVYFHGQAVDMSSYIRQGVVARYKLPLKN
nr:cytoskeleton protein RodZ [uncultured Tolumonas sp.]